MLSYYSFTTLRDIYNSDFIDVETEAQNGQDISLTGPDGRVEM